MTESFICDKIRFLRNEMDISAREMSLELEQNSSYINKVETGQHSLTLKSFFKICDFFELTPSQFLKQDEKDVLSPKEEILLNSFRQLSDKQANSILQIVSDLAKQQAAAHD